MLMNIIEINYTTRLFSNAIYLRKLYHIPFIKSNVHILLNYSYYNNKDDHSTHFFMQDSVFNLYYRNFVENFI